MEYNERIKTVLAVVARHYALILVGILLVHLLRNKYRKVLWRIPGPTLAGYTRLWRLYNTWRGSSHLTYAALHRKYGPLVRVGPNVVSVGDPNAILVIYGLNTGFTKSPYFRVYAPIWKGKQAHTLFTATDETWHRQQRRAIASTYAMKSLLQTENLVDSCTALFMNKLNDVAASGESLRLAQWFNFYSFDVVAELTFNKKLGFLEQGRDVDSMLERIKMAVTFGSHSGHIPEVQGLIFGNPLFHKIFPDFESMNQVLTFTLNLLESRGFLQNGEICLDKESTGKDQTAQWIAARSQDPTRLSSRDIIGHTLSNVIAGSDTTAIQFRTIFYHLLRNPQKMTKLVREIDLADRDGKLSNPITYREASTNLHYLQAVVKESVRIYPSISELSERVVPAGGAEICGHHIPGGTVVGISPWVIQHDPRMFDRPDEFIPERWIEIPPDRLAQMEHSILTFGTGARTCLGKNIAMIEMNKLIPEILREFAFTLIDPDQEIETAHYLFMWQSEFSCRIEKRVKDSSREKSHHAVV